MKRLRFCGENRIANVIPRLRFCGKIPEVELARRLAETTKDGLLHRPLAWGRVSVQSHVGESTPVAKRVFPASEREDAASVPGVL